MKLDFKNTTIAILLICLFLSISKCSHNENKAFKTTEAMLDTTKYFKNKLGTETASKIVLETDLKTFKQLVLKKDFEGVQKLRSDLSDGDHDKEEKFQVLTKTNCSAILLECGFMDNPIDYEKLWSEDYLEKLVDSLFETIVELQKI